MSYGEFCIELFTREGSPFKMPIYNNFSVGAFFTEVGYMLAYWIGCFFKIILDGMNDFAIGAYKFLSFSNSEVIAGKYDHGVLVKKGLYQVLTDYIWIPVLICGLILCFKVLFGQKGVGKTFLRNIGYIFVAVAILPSAFTYINSNIIDDNYFSSMTINEDNTSSTQTTTGTTDEKPSLANRILRSNSVDRLWMYDYLVGKSNSNAFKELESKVSTVKDFDSWSFAWDLLSYRDFHAAVVQQALNMQGNLLETGPTEDDIKNVINTANGAEAQEAWINSDVSKHLSFKDYGIITEKLTIGIKNKWEDSDNYAQATQNNNGTTISYVDGIPNFFKMKVISTPKSDSGEDADNYGISRVSDGTEVLGHTFGKESYWRYGIDWVNVYIEILANAYVLFVVGYCAVKLIIELIVHQLFGGMMAAIDLSDGDKIRKFFSAIVGCYMGLLLGAMVQPLYYYGCDYIKKSLNINSGFVKALLEIVLALVIVNVPNIISMYFGINTGARAGGALFGAGAMLAWRAGKAGVRAGVGVGIGAVRAPFRAGEKWQHIGHQRLRERRQNARFDAAQTERRQNTERAEQRYNAAQVEKRENAERSEQRYNASQAERARQNDISDKRNEYRDLSGNSGWQSLSNEAHGRDNNLDYSAVEQRQEELGRISEQAENAGGSREAYVRAAEERMKAAGSFNPTKKTVEYAADAAKAQKEGINQIASSITEKSHGTIYGEGAQRVAIKYATKGWGASKENMNSVFANNEKASKIPRKPKR